MDRIEDIKNTTEKILRFDRDLSEAGYQQKIGVMKANQDYLLQELSDRDARIKLLEEAAKEALRELGNIKNESYAMDLLNAALKEASDDSSGGHDNGKS